MCVYSVVGLSSAQKAATATSSPSASTTTSSIATVDDEVVWICKRYRGRQSVDYPLTRQLSCALRHLDSAPRLASRYIPRPLLYENRKFDLRYYVLVHSLEPLIIYRYRHFIVRCANKPYSAADLEDYQTHFTLMSLLDDPTMASVRGEGTRADPTMDELIRYFDTAYGPGSRSGDKLYAPLVDHTTSYSGGGGSNGNSSSSSSSGSSKEGLISEGRSATRGGDPIQSWARDVQPAVDATLRDVFESVRAVRGDEPPHPSGDRIHPNAGPYSLRLYIMQLIQMFFRYLFLFSFSFSAPIAFVYM